MVSDVGCQDGMLALRTVLHTRHDHDLPSHAAFVDLVKAFDTVNHKLLLSSLAKFGAPPKFVHAIECVRRDMRITLKLGKLNLNLNKQ